MRNTPRSSLTLAAPFLIGLVGLVSLPAQAQQPQRRAAVSKDVSGQQARLAADTPAGAASASSPTATEGDGCIEAAEGAICEQVKAGSTVPLYGVFIAGPAGATLAFRSGVTVTLEQGSRLRVLHNMLVTSAGKSDMEAEQVYLQSGRAQVNVPQHGQGARRGLFVRGPGQTSAIVPSGQTIVKVNGDAMSVGTISGTPAVLSHGNTWHLAKTGSVRMMKGDGTASGRSLPDAPQTFDCKTLAFAGTTLGDPVTVRWHRSSDTVRNYEVEVMRPGESTPFARSVVGASENAVSFPMLPAGIYSARVRAVDLDSFVGAWSKPLRIDVVGTRLPADARLSDDGSVLMPADDSIELSHTQGLEADVLRVAQPVSAPTKVNMTSRMPTLVRLHRPGESESISLRVAPVEVQAAVGFDPAPNAPEPSLAIVVRLHAADGGALPANLKVRPVALLGGENLDLNWRRQGDALRAIVPLRQVTGGEELRVRVMDGRGRQMGGGQWGADRVASR